MRGSPSIPVLAVDPDLASGLCAEEAAEARERTHAALERVDAGPWTPPRMTDEPLDAIGFLIVDGVLARDVDIAGIGCTDVLGPGDLLQPADVAEGEPSIPMGVRFEALEPTRLAILDGRFAEAISPWPSVSVRLFARCARVTQSLGVHFAITCFVGLELRLFLLFWHLADRFGRVEPDGVVVPIRLTHETLARIVRARRPSVTTALTHLADRGLVARREDAWILRGDPRRELERLRGARPDSGARDVRGGGSDADEAEK